MKAHLGAQMGVWDTFLPFGNALQTFSETSHFCAFLNPVGGRKLQKLERQADMEKTAVSVGVQTAVLVPAAHILWNNEEDRFLGCGDGFLEWGRCQSFRHLDTASSTVTIHPKTLTIPPRARRYKALLPRLRTRP